MKPMRNTYRRSKLHKACDCEMCSEKVGKKPERLKAKDQTLSDAHNYLLETNGHGE